MAPESTTNLPVKLEENSLYYLMTARVSKIFPRNKFGTETLEGYNVEIPYLGGMAKIKFPMGVTLPEAGKKYMFIGLLDERTSGSSNKDTGRIFVNVSYTLGTPGVFAAE